MPRCTTATVSVIAITIGMVMPLAAQQAQRAPQSYWQNVGQPTEQDNLKIVATNVNAQRSDLFGKKDLPAIAALYTQDATYIELMPQIQVMTGRDQVQQHLRELMTANATENVPTVTTAQMDGNGEIMVGGDYYLVVGGKKVGGRFFQALRNEGGTWKIAMHAFARTQPVTTSEVSNYHVGG
jgi:ketosteroid isomerase-like protein